MKSKYLMVAALSVAAVIAFAQETQTEKSAKSSTPKKIGTLEATNFIGKTMVVTGKVVQVTTRPTINYINLDERYPKSPFTGVIFPSATNEFPNLKELKGKDVELTGKTAEYHGKPQIVLNKSNQVHVVEKKTDEAK
jgi:DNA/RNA endonuclease YhcR with UshA esterase domain